MRLANVTVAARLKEGASTQGHLPATRAVAEVGGDAVTVSTEDSSTRHEYDYCVGEGVDEGTLLTRCGVHKLLRQLLGGISVGILGVGIEAEKAGSFAGLIRETLLVLQRVVEEQDDMEIALSYALFGISDASCIDLLTYERKELAEIGLLKEWASLNPVESLGPVTGAVEQGYSLPCVLLVRLFVRSSDETLPGAMSTLALADLGSCSTGAPLEKSFAQLRSTILTMDQPVVHATMPEAATFLSALIGDCFGGDMLTLVVADVPKVAVARNMQSFVQLLDAARRIKNRPTPMLETPEMLELGALVEAHGKLEIEHRAVRRELKQLKNVLRVTEAQREELIAESKSSSMQSGRQRCEFEYQLARLSMEKVQVHERIRQCEIDLVCMEHERLLLLAEMEIKQRQLSELEARLQSSVDEKERIREEMGAKVEGLSTRLDSAQQQLDSTERERQGLKGSLAAASERIVVLEARIGEIERAKSRTEERLESRTADGAKQIEAKSHELARLKEDLGQTRASEQALQSKLSELERATGTYLSVVRDLETKLSVLKIENVTLQAKLEVLSKAPQSPEVSRTIKAMEAKWREERDAMHTVMTDLRALVGEKARDTIVPEKAKAVVAGIPLRGRPRKSTVAFEGNNYNADEYDGDNDDDDNSKPPARPAAKKPAAKSASEVARRPPSATAATAAAKSAARRAPQRREAEDIETQTIAPRTDSHAKVKLGGRGAKVQPSEAEEPLGKILDGEEREEVVIPGTPQKASPSKVAWKASAFIPGLAAAKKGGDAGSVFANLSFGGGGGDAEGFRKRIKLPERARAAVPEDGEQLAAARRNVDPNAFSTIMTSFNVPPRK